MGGAIRYAGKGRRRAVKRGLPSPRVFLAFALLAALVPDLALAQGRPIPASVSAAFSRAGIQVAARRFQTYDFSLPLINGKLQSLSALKGRVEKRGATGMGLEGKVAFPGTKFG